LLENNSGLMLGWAKGHRFAPAQTFPSTPRKKTRISGALWTYPAMKCGPQMEKSDISTGSSWMKSHGTWGIWMLELGGGFAIALF
jgi:hypothetical protein